MFKILRSCTKKKRIWEWLIDWLVSYLEGHIRMAMDVGTF